MPDSRGRRAPESERPSEELSAERRSRALEEPLDVRPRPGSPYAGFEVRNPRRKTRYQVLMPEFPGRGAEFCSCSDFGRRGIGTCKHLEAVQLWIHEHPGEGGPTPEPFSGASTWASIDRGVRVAEGDRSPDPIRYRKAGRALIEPTAD